MIRGGRQDLNFKDGSQAQHIRTEIDIDARAEAVWAVLVDMPRWHTWNSVIVDLPEVNVGAKGTLSFSPDGDGKLQTAGITLREVNAETFVLRWGGGLGPLLQADHWMRLERRGSGSCRLLHGENITGLLPALNLGLPYEKLYRLYIVINDALKAKMEGRTAARAK